MVRDASASLGPRRVRRVRRRRTRPVAESPGRSRSASWASGAELRPRRPPSYSDSRSPTPRRRRRIRARRRRDSDGGDETKVKIFVLHNDCAKIIGRGGRMMREIEARSRSRLKVQKESEMDDGSKERYVEITGTAREYRAAMRMLLDLATFVRKEDGEVLKGSASTGEPTASPEAPLVIDVLPDEVGRILGRNGDTVKRMEDATNTKIELDKPSGKLEIYGQKESQDKALELVLQEVTYAKGADGTMLKDSVKHRASNPDPEQPPRKIWVRDREAGRVIGRGGETVREIMEKTGSDIKVQKSQEMTGPDREILIFGTEEQQKAAVHQILKEVTWCKDEEKVLKEPPQPSPPSVPSAQIPQTQAIEDAKEPSAEGGQGEEDTAEKVVEVDEPGDGDGDDDESMPKKAKAIKPLPDDKKGLWVCGTCGGDHRSKDCPHKGQQGVQNGMQMGVQMGMQMAAAQGMMMNPTMMTAMRAGMMNPMMMNPMMMTPAMMAMMGGPGTGDSSSDSSSQGSASRASDSEFSGKETAMPQAAELVRRRRRRRVVGADADEREVQPVRKRRRAAAAAQEAPVRKKKNVEISDL